MNNVYNIKTGKVLFTASTRAKIGGGLSPYLRDDTTDATREQAINTIEQVLCGVVVAGAVAFAEKVAAKIISYFGEKGLPNQNPPQSPV